MNLLTLFNSTCNRFPDKVAFDYEGRKATFSRIRQQAEIVCENLKRLGLQRRERIALYLHNSLDFIYAYLGVLSAGGVVVPMNVMYRSREVMEILEDSGARGLISDGEQLEQINDISPRLRESLAILDIKDIKAPWPEHSSFFPSTSATSASPREDIKPFSFSSCPAEEGGSGAGLETAPILTNKRGSGVPEVSLDQNDMAAICYTSGTTGRSKGAVLSHGNFIANIQALIEIWEWTSRDVFLLAVPMFHMHGLGVGLNGALTTGCSTILMKRFEAEKVLQAIQENRCTLFMGVPTMYARFLQVPKPERFDLTSMRLFISGSAPLSVELFHQFKETFGFEILERYGLTETIMNISNPYRGRRKPGSVGLPLPGVQVRIVNANGNEVEKGQIGEITVKGSNVFQGYWKRPEATGKALKNGWMYTGDLGYEDQEGYIFIAGRAKDVIITGGFNVYPREVEEVVCSHPAVREAAVVGIPDKIRGEVVKAYVVVNDSEGQNPGLEEDLINYCKKSLAGFKVPRKIEFLAVLPRTASGKVITHQLPNLTSC